MDDLPGRLSVIPHRNLCTGDEEIPRRSALSTQSFFLVAYWPVECRMRRARSPETGDLTPRLVVTPVQQGNIGPVQRARKQRMVAPVSKKWLNALLTRSRPSHKGRKLVGALRPPFMETHFLVLFTVGDRPVFCTGRVLCFATFVFERQDCRHERFV